MTTTTPTATTTGPRSAGGLKGGFVLSIFKPHSQRRRGLGPRVEQGGHPGGQDQPARARRHRRGPARCSAADRLGGAARRHDPHFSDALTAVPLWFAFVLARRAPTRRYTYGYGRAPDPEARRRHGPRQPERPAWPRPARPDRTPRALRSTSREQRSHTSDPAPCRRAHRGGLHVPPVRRTRRPRTAPARCQRGPRVPALLGRDEPDAASPREAWTPPAGPPMQINARPDCRAGW